MNTTRVAVGLASLLVLAIAPIAHADHAWAPYHWARTANPFALQLGDSVTSTWDSYLRTAAADWSVSSVMDVSVVASGKNAKTCKPTMGRGEVCNAKYGFNGWMGIAQIWISGEHISQGIVKLNDTYFNLKAYNTPAWRNIVMCQEVGHLFGLDHQDEDMTNANLGTCMDYTNDPSTNQHPNQHDYDMLETIYAHLDTSTTLKQATAGKAQEISGDAGDWGREIERSRDGRASLFEREFEGGQKVFTHVFWADPAEDERFSRSR
ncbi:hypothetical protein HY969_04765 [Candidatus Kaiserbacteria bacterium]|nr:hypothetical protein [Candidatus Kaiserbacteria bacterium]